jgi:hypothetical protein
VSVNTVFHDSCEVAVVGAGPYGLSLGAHLGSAMIDTRVFGRPMSFWRHHMPKGMKLRSAWDASHIADPDNFLLLDAYATMTGLGRTDPLPREDFVLTLEDGKVLTARHVVVAAGLAKQDFRPAAFRGLPADLVSHTADHASLDGFRTKRVAVVGRGQSACESAALLAEAGAEVELICRAPIRWLGGSGVGPFPLNWLNAAPDTLHRVPPLWRDWLDAFSLQARPAAWVRPRLAGVRIDAGRRIRGACPNRDGIILELDNGARGFDHVLLATGYKIDIARLGFIGGELASRILTDGGSPVLSSGYESSVRGLHFVGASAVRSFGPLLGFVAGAGHAARAVTARVLADRSGPTGRRSTISEPDAFARRVQTASPLNRTAPQNS